MSEPDANGYPGSVSAHPNLSRRLDIALQRLAGIPVCRLYRGETPVESLCRLEAQIRGGPRLLVKRDDAIPFGFGGNKVRKLERVLCTALADGADTLVTIGSVQSNHARVTAAAAAWLGLDCVLVVSGSDQVPRRGNMLIDQLLGAEIRYVSAREERETGMAAVVAELQQSGRRPFPVPPGASTPLGALGYASAVSELLDQIPAPEAIVHATSSGGTQAGLILGCALHGVHTRVIGISSDDSADEIGARIAAILRGAAGLLDLDEAWLMKECIIEVDDGFVGEGYGIPSGPSQEAQLLAARQEALFVDPTYTAKAFAGLLALASSRTFAPDETVLFWHTGGQAGLFAKPPCVDGLSWHDPFHCS